APPPPRDRRRSSATRSPPTTTTASPAPAGPSARPPTLACARSASCTASAPARTRGRRTAPAASPARLRASLPPHVGRRHWGEMRSRPHLRTRQLLSNTFAELEYAWRRARQAPVAGRSAHRARSTGDLFLTAGRSVQRHVRLARRVHARSGDRAGPAFRRTGVVGLRQAVA